MKHIDKINSIVSKFRDHFQYDCEVPFAVLDGDESEIYKFNQNVEKSISDNFDYTIQLYGTTPIPKGNRNDVLID